MIWSGVNSIFVILIIYFEIPVPGLNDNVGIIINNSGNPFQVSCLYPFRFSQIETAIIVIVHKSGASAISFDVNVQWFVLSTIEIEYETEKSEEFWHSHKFWFRCKDR